MTNAVPTSVPPSGPARGRRPGGLLILAVAILLAAVFAVAGDMREVARLLDRTEWSRLPLALLLTAVSYGCASVALVVLGSAMGISAPTGPMLRIALVSISVNNLVSFGGVAGYSLRAALSRPHGVVAGHSFAMSLTHGYLNNLVMFVLLAVTLFQLVGDPTLDEAWRQALAAAGVLAVVFALLTSAALFSRRVRGALIRLGVRLSRYLPGRWASASASALGELDEALARASAAFRRSPAAMGWPVALLCVQWAATAGAFWSCLRAFTGPVDWVTVVSGFSIGAVAGFASLLPGGIGVQDGSQATVLALRGVPLEVAVLAAVLFRLVYYVGPFVLTLPLCASLLRRRQEG